eukprot:TRINITY_DN649_c0_g2_i1.p1 TRINITY_DN649_c0_g2~~TRINITY_DN649_c0_g2_i1.p1  ORF type:complete len:121 (-),score=14.66 TRINITY_DN649_c0_g2_i1:66-428(-)
MLLNTSKREDYFLSAGKRDWSPRPSYVREGGESQMFLNTSKRENCLLFSGINGGRKSISGSVSTVPGSHKHKTELVSVGMERTKLNRDCFEDCPLGTRRFLVCSFVNLKFALAPVCKPLL